LLTASFVALLASLAYGGGAAAPDLIDPGEVVRWGLPITKLVVNLAVGVTIGALVMACFALSPKEREYSRALDVAAAGAALWTVSSAISAFFAFASLGQPFSWDPRYGDAFGSFITNPGLPGQAWLVMALAGAILTIACFAVRNQVVMVFLAGGAALALLRLSEEGHTGDAANHDQAVTAIWLHMIFAGVWLGGLLTLMILRPVLDRGRLLPVLTRYSSLALVSFIVVAASGYLSALIRVEALPNLLSPYGVLVILKVAALIALGVFGAFQRRALIGRIGRGGGSPVFWTMVGVELAFMGIASGVAAALARTATPIPETGTSDLSAPSPARLLTDKPLPPELTLERWFTSWNVDLLWLLVGLFGIFFYLAGVVRLRRRGDTWPWHRAVLWTIGMLLFIWTTNGALNVYEQFLFSAHMMAHMLLSMAIPVFLVLSAPVTLALRTIERRTDGSRGPREWILFGVHNPVATFLTNPWVAAGIFAASLWVFYYSPLFRWATEQHVGHMWMVAHFLIVGYLFVQALVGIDPVAGRPSYPLRLLLLLATMAMHAFFGLGLLEGSGLLMADWYGAMGREWGDSPLEDQQNAGGIAWSVGEIPTVSLAIIVAILWSRSDEREQKRSDRRADRDGDAELGAYNEMLARRGVRDEVDGPR